MPVEARILLWIHEQATPALDALFRFSHVIGSEPFCALLVVGMAIWHRARGEAREALLWLALGLTTYALLEGIKPVVARPRPELWPRLVQQGGFSFPSGHALASATFYPLLALTVSRLRAAPAGLSLATGIGVALFVGLGRLYLGVHWPSDVLTGWTLGSVQSGLAILWLRRRDAGGGS